MSRPRLPREIETQVLTECRRRCTICFGLNKKNIRKKGQIAHLDQNPQNNKKANLVFLCLAHHDEYDGKTSQSKNFTIDEVRTYRGELIDYMKGGTDSDASSVPDSKIQLCSPEVYKLRLPVYQAVQTVLVDIISDGTISRETLSKFARDTDQAPFLFDHDIERYLRDMHRRAIKIRSLSVRLEREVSEKNRELLLNDMEKQMFWFFDEIDAFKKRFSKFMTLKSS